MRHTQKGAAISLPVTIGEHFLLTKLYVPPARSDLVPRPRLNTVLAAGLAGPLTLVSAPAGFGKTTLLSAWRASPEGASCRLGWLSLDSDDDEPVRFLLYLAAALETAQPGIGAQAAKMLHSPQPPPLRTVLAALLNRLAGLQDDLVLVLDDYQVLENPAIHDAMIYLFEHQPPQLHVAILSRADPPLPLARLRTRGHLVEIRAADLRFTPQEAALFLNEVMHLTLVEQELAAVVSRTEGWVAGLQLAALSLRGRSDATGFLEAFAGTNRYIVGYLMDEVVGRQSQHVRDFLLRTCVLERMCAPLCDAMANDRPEGDVQSCAPVPDGSAILEYLERANLFVVPLDQAGHWYRYHHLFRDFLRAYLQKLLPADVPTLHRRASQWYEAEGLVLEAVKHAFLAEDLAYAAAVVERHGMPMLMRSGIRIVYEWCTTFPEEVMLAHPLLCIYHAWTLVLAYRDDNRKTVEERLQQAERAASQLDDAGQARWLAGQAAVPRAFLRMTPNPAADPREQLAQAQQALDLLPPGDPLRSTTTLTIGYAYMALQDPQAAFDALEEARQLALAGHNYYGAADALFQEARLAHSQGQLRRAAQICRQGQDSFRALFARPEQELPAVGGLDIALGCVLLEQNHVPEAEQALLHGLDLVGWGMNPYDQMIAYVALFRLREIQGRYDEALAFVDRMAEMWPDVAFCAQALRIVHFLRIAPNDPKTLAAAAAWADTSGRALGDGLPLPGTGPFGCAEDYYLARLARARAQIATGKPQAAIAYVEQQMGPAQANGLGQRVIELCILQAQAFHALGETRRTGDVLGRALAAAEPEGYVRVFDEGPVMVRLLTEAAMRGIAPGYVGRLLTIFGTRLRAQAPASMPGASPLPGPGGAAPKLPPSPLVEQLTERECEVLHLLSEGCSNLDIAGRLYIEVGTVKQHVNHVLGKLGATSRMQAVAKARALGLLP